MGGLLDFPGRNDGVDPDSCKPFTVIMVERSQKVF